MGDRGASFHLVDRVAIKGGYAGLGATDPYVRDIALYETILSGDLAGDDAPVLDPCDLLTEPTRAENSYAVVTGVPCSRSAVLDGFTISSGNAIATNRLEIDQNGAGLLLSCYGSDCCPSIRNCTFTGNCAYRGGAVYVIGARPALINCKFLDNAAIKGGAILTSAWRDPVWHISDCDFVVSECVFSGNYARDAGGTMHTTAGAPFTIDSSIFTKNFAGAGGAIRDSVGVNMANCLFAHNVADRTGGAVYSDGYKLDVASCTFAGNAAPAGRALTCFTPVTTIANSIFWNGGDERHAEIHMGSITGMDLTYSNVRGGWPDEGNIDVDPLFADPDSGDFHLKSQAGRWDAVTRSWVVDDVTSPCIDAGDPDSPMRYEPEPNGGRINMGAYGGTAEASMSPHTPPTPEPWSDPVPLAEVNLDWAEEWSPVLSADGLTLYFGRVRTVDEPLGRIFQATRQSALPWSRFTAAAEIPGALNQSADDVLCPWVSPDGLRIYYTFQSDSVFRLMVSERPADLKLWPAGTEIHELNQLDRRLHTCRLTADELTIFFAGPDIQRGWSDYDIWTATRPDRDAPFDDPVNLATINSASSDIHASPSSDGLILYFASSRRGRYQLFRSMRESREAPFGPPVHMALFDTPNGNSTFPYLAPDGTEFYFVRETAGGRSTRDIWVSYRID
jgi:hypothetical protein